MRGAIQKIAKIAFLMGRAWRKNDFA